MAEPNLATNLLGMREGKIWRMPYYTTDSYKMNLFDPVTEKNFFE
jgi:hypothetical protein